jgi:hypothetical protein
MNKLIKIVTLAFYTIALVSCKNDFESLESKIADETGFKLETETVERDPNSKVIHFAAKATSANYQASDRIKGVIDKHLNMIGEKSKSSNWVSWEKPELEVSLKIFSNLDSISGIIW